MSDENNDEMFFSEDKLFEEKPSPKKHKKKHKEKEKIKELLLKASEWAMQDAIDHHLFLFWKEEMSKDSYEKIKSQVWKDKR